MNQIVDMDYLTAVENKARAELDMFTENNTRTLNVIRLAKIGLLASEGQVFKPTAFTDQPALPADEE